MKSMFEKIAHIRERQLKSCPSKLKKLQEESIDQYMNKLVKIVIG